MRRRRALAATTWAAVALGAVGALAGCGSDAKTLPAPSASVTANARHFSFDAPQADRSEWPAPCALLSKQSAAAAIGTSVTTKRFHNNCYYLPQSAAFPTLTITVLGAGYALQGTYDAHRDQVARYRPHNVNGVGEEAIGYTVHRQDADHLAVLSAQGCFDLGLKSPVSNTVNPRSQDALVSVGKAVSKEFGG